MAAALAMVLCFAGTGCTSSAIGTLASAGAKAVSTCADESPHTVRFVNVAPNVRLEVLDWGGSGPPLVLLTGLGDTAHVYDDFAQQWTPFYH
ncbi:MAG TPA: hypothetical protein VJP76_07530, partial [Candidatus Tumulicola sp.]|nr:hypothetical protein [Candidatus Tumulicola sp.]